MKCLVFNSFRRYLIVLFVALFYVGGVQAELHPKIEEALNRDPQVDGFIFDIQSSDPDYYENNLPYLIEQLEAIYDYNRSYKVVILSRGREIQSFLTVNHQKPDAQIFKSFHEKDGLQIQVDIETAVSLGYSERSFPQMIDILSDSYTTIAAGRVNNMEIIELQRMSVQEKSQIGLSPTWRTDSID